MSERERWIVYPLLFLALGVSLREKLVPTLPESVYCKELVVVDERHPTQALVKIGGSQGAGEGGPAGVLLVNGRISAVDAVVERELQVHGFVNATNYAFRNVPVVPFQIALPGAPERAGEAQAPTGDGRGG
jgi:hypothetical protein